MIFSEQLDRELLEYLESQPKFALGDLPLEQIAELARANAVQSPLERRQDIQIINEFLPENATPLRIYQPVRIRSKVPVFVYFHGGGFFSGNLDANDSICQHFAHSADCVVVAVDYRKTPEHPYPAGFDDCYEALVWASDNARFNAGAVVLGGISAGAAMAAATVLKARDINGPSINGQILAIPSIDHRLQTASAAMDVDPRVWNRSLARKAWTAYLKDVEGEIPVYASPSLASDFSGLPPTFISAEGADILRDEAIDFARNLMSAGVMTDLRVYAGAYHGSFAYVPTARISKQHLGDITSALIRLFNDGR